MEKLQKAFLKEPISKKVLLICSLLAFISCFFDWHPYFRGIGGTIYFTLFFSFFILTYWLAPILEIKIPQIAKDIQTGDRFAALLMTMGVVLYVMDIGFNFTIGFILVFLSTTIGFIVAFFGDVPVERSLKMIKKGKEKVEKHIEQSKKAKKVHLKNNQNSQQINKNNTSYRQTIQIQEEHNAQNTKKKMTGTGIIKFAFIGAIMGVIFSYYFQPEMLRYMLGSIGGYLSELPGLILDGNVRDRKVILQGIFISVFIFTIFGIIVGLFFGRLNTVNYVKKIENGEINMQKHGKDKLICNKIDDQKKKDACIEKVAKSKKDE